MKCRRCEGLTIDVSFSGGLFATGAWEYDGWKCMNCGFVTDPLIEKNKNWQGQAMWKHTLQSHDTTMTCGGAHVAA